MFLVKKFHTSAEQERGYHSVRLDASAGMTGIASSALYDMSVLDGKSSALLTFISLVIACLIFSLSLVDGSAHDAHVIRGGIFLFMALFSYAAWLDLRCLYALGPRDLPTGASIADYEKVSLAELAARRARYRLSLLICEVSFALLLPFVALWGLVATHIIDI